MDCDACASGSLGLYRTGCPQCDERHEARCDTRAAARRYLTLAPDEQLAQTRRWKAALDLGTLRVLRRMIEEERQCLTE